mmetsp:Transcript_37216/g.81018  ORF Transcript_37216/g.81018 Transcript_37216/m.81018 type:complete len:355 (+) Transcript_37216:70-1134(+)
MADDSSNDDPNDALPLSDLERWVSPSTLEWLDEGDREKAAIQAEIDEDEAGYANYLFAQEEILRGLENEKGEQEPAKDRQVLRWSSSRTNPDGVNGTLLQNAEKNDEDGAVNTIYILSEALAGFGDQVWASSRHVSNCLANADRCREILSPLLTSSIHREEGPSEHKHPLLGTSFLELGAGAGVPGWTAMRCGARVICTDQAVADRIRCLAECAERNYCEMKDILPENDERLVNAAKTTVYPYNWGDDVHEVSHALSKDGKERFDVIVGADCVYMPWLHDQLLQSIDMLLSDRGVALLPFALHGNAKDRDVWGIADKAKTMGFKVAILEKQQLTPQKRCMEAKQGLVHTVRLSR